MVLGGQPGRQRRACQSRLHDPTARITSARHTLFIAVSQKLRLRLIFSTIASQAVDDSPTLRSFGSTPPVDFDRACFDPRNELMTKLDCVIERIEAADKKRIYSERVVFQDGFGDLFRCPYKT